MSPTNQSKVGVFGASGHQGGAVVRALLKDGFKVVSFTRTPDSDKAKELKGLGSEVVQLDESQPNELLEKELSKVDKVFLNLNTPAYPADKELEYGLKIANISLKVGVKHFVFSTLPNVTKLTNGRVTLPESKSKELIEEHLKKLSQENPTFTVSFVSAPWYFQNFLGYFPPTQVEGADNLFAVTMAAKPEQPVVYGDIGQLGTIVSHIFNHPTKYANVLVSFSGQLLTPQQIVDTLSEVSGKKVVYNYLPVEEFAKLEYPGADAIAKVFDFYNEFNQTENKQYFNSLTKEILNVKSFKEYLIEINYKL